MPQDSEKEQRSKLIAIIQEALQRDETLRQNYQIGERFKFVRERLQSLLENVEKDTETKEARTIRVQDFKLEEDEVLVYVHLFNAQGLNVRTWSGMLTPKALFDYSVNRPIYQEQKNIEAFIRSKSNKTQHAYLTVAMKKDRVLPMPEDVVPKDLLGNSLLKIKEGSLRYDRLVSFTHNEQIYYVAGNGDLIKKNEEPNTVK